MADLARNSLWSYIHLLILHHLHLREPDSPAPFYLCAEHVRQLEGESPFDNLMEVKS
jgi:hypothetical protein